MKKQISYPSFITRIFATNIDLLLIAVVLLPLMQLFRHKITLMFLGEQLLQAGIDTSNQDMVYIALNDPEFIQRMHLEDAMSLFAFVTIIQLFFIAVWLIGFWCKFGTSPGKIIMRLRVVDADTLQPISLGKAIIRCLGYLTAPIAIFSIFFNDKRRTLYDIWSNSVVIKS